MSKRSFEERLDHYAREIKKLKSCRKRIRIISSSDSEDNSDYEPNNIDAPVPSTSAETPQVSENQNQEHRNAIIPETIEPSPESVTVPVLDPEILLALGEATEEAPKYGDKIHDNLARLWQPILRKGLKTEAKEKLLKQFLVPENCTLLQAPKLDVEISAAVSDVTRLRDKRVESVQQQLGLGITALNRGLSLLLDDAGDRVQAIKFISDSCRILCDVHFTETEARKKFITPGLDKSFLNIIKDVDRDETLFGNKLSEKIKASRAIEKQGLQIKKPALTNKTPSTSAAPSMSSRPRPQGNWPGPPRYSSSRGGRGGSRRTFPAGRRPPQAPASKPQAPAKPRATTQP